jgi:hypothetical protein
MAKIGLSDDAAGQERLILEGAANVAEELSGMLRLSVSWGRQS